MILTFILSTTIWFKLVSKFILLTQQISKFCFKYYQKCSFKIYYLIFEKPLPSKGGWMGDHALYALMTIFYHVHERVVVMSYTHDLHGILFLYTHMYFVYMYASNFKWYFHTYIYMIFIVLALQCLYIFLEHKLFILSLT